MPSTFWLIGRSSMDSQIVLLAAAFLTVAILYSSVGHAGATGYLAVMAIAGMSPALMKPTALILNIVVASIATYKYYRRGAFSWALFVPLVLTSFPFAYLGGSITLPAQYYKPLVGIFLLYSAWRFIASSRNCDKVEIKPVSWPILLICGSGLGFLSGLTGVGGGVFLSPLMLLMHWAPIRVISGVASAFILSNSISGLAGLLTTHIDMAPGLPWWMLAVMLGGLIGAEFGSGRFKEKTIQRLLAVTLLIAGLKLSSSLIF